MKKIIIELTEAQHAQLQNLITHAGQTDLENETFSGFQINLNTCQIADWLEFDYNNRKTDLGSVTWKIG